MVCLMLLFNVTSVYACDINEYGGISGSADNPPEGTQIDTKLSEYYNMPVATGTGAPYWYIASFWYTSEEMKKLPSESNNVAMPVSPFVVVAFLGMAFHVSRKI